MTDDMISIMHSPSRRRLLRGAAVLGGGVALAAVGVMAGASAAAPTKLSQKVAGYQDKPMGAARCENCTLWQPAQDCKLVQGPISPKGWCNLYSAKS
jgi:hypothetical protein